MPIPIPRPNLSRPVPAYGNGNSFLQYLRQMFSGQPMNNNFGPVPSPNRPGMPPRMGMSAAQTTPMETPDAQGRIVHMANPTAYQGQGAMTPEQEARMTGAMNPYQKAAWTGQGDPGQFVRQGNHLVTQQVASGLSMNDWLAKQSGKPVAPTPPPQSLIPLPPKQ